MAKNHLILKVVFVSGFLGLNACSFKKGSDEAPTTPPNVIIEKESVHAKSPQEALLASDMAGFEKHLSTMNAETVNAYLEDGGTLLEMAVRNNNLYAVELLLKKGALPLKPRKNSSQTPLAISEKLNPSIYQAFVENLTVVKKDILAKLQQGQALAALQVMDTNFISRDAKISESSNILEILIDSQATLTPDTREALMTLLPLKASLENRAEKLLTLALSDKELFKVSVETLKKQAVSVPGSLRLTLLKQTSQELFAAHLASFNSYPSNQKVPLAELQKILITKAIDSQQEGQFINVESLRLPLSLMKSEASDQVFSAECIELILRSPKLAAQRAEIVSLVIMNSSDAPAGFIKSLVGRLPLNDFKHVVNVLPLKVRQDQKDAFDSNWSKEEYKEMKGAGMTIPANVTLKLFRELFEERFKGNTAANERLASLKGEAKEIRDYITAEEQLSLFSREFKYSFGNDLKEDDLMGLIAEISTSDIPGVFAGTIEVVEKVFPGKGQKTTTPYFLNPLTLVKIKSSQNANQSFKIAASRFYSNIAHAAPKLNDSWLLKSATWEITNHDVLWFHIIQQPALQLKLIPALSNPSVEKIFKQWNKLTPLDSSNYKILLSSTDSRYATGDAEYRNKYLPFLLQSPVSEVTEFILSDILAAMPKSAHKTDSSVADKFVSFILSTPDKKLRDSLFINRLLPYIQKQNPRFALALAGESKRYLKYLSGTFVDDPLCFSYEKDIYKQTCDSHNKEPNFEYPFPAPKTSYFPDVLKYRQAKSDWEASSQKDYILNKIGQDKMTIEALKVLANNSVPDSETESFFKANPWIFEATFVEHILTLKIPLIK